METKKNETFYEELNAVQMREINGGGYWIVYTTPEGKVIKIWVR